MNYESQPLQRHEITAMKANEGVIERVFQSYDMMLGFYGMKLLSRETGELARATNYLDRYRNFASECSQCDVYSRLTRDCRGTPQ